jgi:hypothetical protein
MPRLQISYHKTECYGTTLVGIDFWSKGLSYMYQSQNKYLILWHVPNKTLRRWHRPCFHSCGVRDEPRAWRQFVLTPPDSALVTTMSVGQNHDWAALTAATIAGITESIQASAAQITQSSTSALITSTLPSAGRKIGEPVSRTI